VVQRRVMGAADVEYVRCFRGVLVRCGRAESGRSDALSSARGTSEGDSRAPRREVRERWRCGRGRDVLRKRPRNNPEKCLSVEEQTRKRRRGVVRLPR